MSTIFRYTLLVTAEKIVMIAAGLMGTGPEPLSAAQLPARVGQFPKWRFRG
jgi:hypothetical protein